MFSSAGIPTTMYRRLNIQTHQQARRMLPALVPLTTTAMRLNATSAVLSGGMRTCTEALSEGGALEEAMAASIGLPPLAGSGFILRLKEYVPCCQLTFVFKCTTTTVDTS